MPTAQFPTLSQTRSRQEILDAGLTQPNAADSSTAEILTMAVEKLDAKQYDEAIRLFTALAERSPRATHYALIGDCYWKHIKLVPQLGDDVDHNPTPKILDWRLMIEDW